MNKQTKAYAIYVLYWPGRREFYVGCSKDAKSRVDTHKWSRPNLLISAITKVFGNPQAVLIDEMDSNQEARDAEAWWISLLEAGGWRSGGLNTQIGYTRQKAFGRFRLAWTRKFSTGKSMPTYYRGIPTRVSGE